jgi:UDPglucose 6-dehydrogenase
MSDITVIGTGYVGLTTGAAFAEMGHHVVCVDVDDKKIAGLQQGLLPIHEPGLQEVVSRALGAGRIAFTTSYSDGLAEAEFVFIAVGTPDDGTGGADLSQVHSAARGIAQELHGPIVVVNKSTVPIGTGDVVTRIIDEYRSRDVPFAVVSNPEFLREGSALEDCLRPDRVVLGSSDREAAQRVAELYRVLDCPIIVTDLRTAEMIKYASNAFLATRISFINEIAAICERLGADVQVVARGMGLDSRIGPAFLDAGLGFGGSCFPKDVRALMRMATDAGQHPQLLKAVMEINDDRRRWVLDKLEARLGDLEGKRVTLLGVSFKPNTDDVREAPSLAVIELLFDRGARVCAYDPAALANALRLAPSLEIFHDPYEAVEGADAVVLVTEWNEFKALDLMKVRTRMRGNLFVDARNLYEPGTMRRIGFDYVGVARGNGPEIPPAPSDQAAQVREGTPISEA